MKKLFTFIAVICLALNASAQYQVANSDFENFLSNGEPNRWHGFKSAKGNFAGMAQSSLGSSDDTRPGTTGSKSAVITSGSVIGIINNGTFTTGQLAAGSMSATNTANNAQMDKSSTATDNNGEKFYMPLSGHPDAVKVWIKFSQGSTNADHPFASANAVIFDGSYYQDPENKTYTNKVAMAKNNQITVCGWTELTIPFDYDDYKDNVGVTNYNNAGGAILVTFGTNADPGQGSKGDQVWVDDMELVYNHSLASVVYDGTNVTVASAMDLSNQIYDENKLTLAHNAKGNAQISKSYNTATGLLTITVYGEDYGTDTETMFQNPNSFTTYTIQFKKPYAKGDVNKDGSVTIADVTALVNMILGKAEKNEMANINGDGDVTIADVTALVNIILGKN